MIPLLESPLAQRLGWTLLHFTWQGALLGLGAWISLALGRRRSPRLRYALACAFLLACLASATLTFASLAPSAAPASDALLVPAAAPVAPLVRQAPASEAAHWEASGLPWQARIQPHLPRILLGWALGVLLLSLRAAGGWLWLRRLRATALPSPEPEWLDRLVRNAGLRRPVRFLESARVLTPMCMGLLRPVILLPLGFFVNLDPLAAEAVLAHELAHLRRLDGLVNGLQCVIEVLFFFHPAVWWISRRIRTEREHCCDDAAVLACGDAVLYAETLSRLDALRDRPPSLALSARGGNLMERLRRLLLADPPQLRFTAPSLAAVALLALVGTLPARAGKPEPPPQPNAARPSLTEGRPQSERAAAPMPVALSIPTVPPPSGTADLPEAPGQVQTPPPDPLPAPAPAGAPAGPGSAPEPTPTSAPAPVPVLQAKDLAIVPGLAIRTLKVPRCPAVIEEELLTWPNKGYAVEVPARTTAALRLRCESGEAYFRVGVTDKWGNPLPGMKGSLGVPWASYTNGSDRPTTIYFFVRTGRNYPGNGKVQIHLTLTPPPQGQPPEAGSAPGTGPHLSPEEAGQLVRRLVDQTAWGPSSNIVKLRVGEPTRWNGAFTNHWPKQAERTALLQAIPVIEGREVSFDTEPIDGSSPSAFNSQSFTVLVDRDRVIHWRTPYPRQRPGENLPEIQRVYPTGPTAPPPQPTSSWPPPRR